MRINGQEFSREIIREIRLIIKKEPELSRGKLSRRVCEEFNLRSSNGRLKEMSCRVALLELERTGQVVLPEPGPSPPRKARDNGSKIKEIEPPIIEDNLSGLGRIEIVKIESRHSKLSRKWNELMDKYHYLGSGPLCGAQIRYLIHSERYGWIGGFAFSAAAWRLSRRDRWIGWGEEARKKHLDKVVNNSRFLIIPHVKVPNLASHVLSRCIKRISRDWQARYKIEPVLLETFVEHGRFKGTSYRAANWEYIGQTKGRGRNDRENTRGLAVKDIYLYPLQSTAREILCDGTEPLVEEKKVPVDWSEEEFGGAELGDKRRVKRLEEIARDFYARPEGSVPQACQSRAKTKAVYRFFDESNNSMEKILAPHYESTLGRIRKEKVVLAVQDTTSLNYSTHPATENLGPIGSTEDGLIGLLVHDTMAFTLEGTPLGLLDVQSWARNPGDFGKKRYRHQLPIEQKESNKWLKSFASVQAAQKRCKDTLLVSVGDREADIYELFHSASGDPRGPKLLVRASQNRLLSGEQDKLMDYVAGQPLSGKQIINVPRKKNQPSREAILEIRYAQVTLKAPGSKTDLVDIRIWAVLAQEVESPQGVTPLKWLLLTTMEVSSFEQAAEKLSWYCLRWGIEVYHKTLKSGCKIEERQLGNADRIESCLAIDMVVAWRIYHLTKLGREIPDLPCTVFFEEAEWKALVAYKTENPIPPKKTPTLREAMRMVASLGGFLGRKSDGEPGTKSLWLGLQQLDVMTAMWKITMSEYISTRGDPLCPA